jgi:hypothetical protein
MPAVVVAVAAAWWQWWWGHLDGNTAADTASIGAAADHANITYKINKNLILLTDLFFHHDGNSSTQQRRQSHKTITIAMLLFATT